MKHETTRSSSKEIWELLTKQKINKLDKVSKKFEKTFYKQFKKPIQDCWNEKDGIVLSKIIEFEPNSWKEVKKKIGLKGLFVYLTILKHIKINSVPDWSIKYKILSFKWVKQKLIYYKRILHQIYTKNLFILRVLCLIK